MKVHFIVWVLAVLLVMQCSFAISNASIQNVNGTQISTIYFERAAQSYPTSLFNFTIGSDSYFDGAYTTTDLLLSVCDSGLHLNDTVGFSYVSNSRNVSASIIPFYMRVSNVTSGLIGATAVNCTQLNVPLSATYAVYPGYVHPIVLYANGSNTTVDSPLFLNGTFYPDVLATGVPKYFTIQTQDIRDGTQTQIERVQRSLVTSVVNSSNISLFESIASPNSTLIYNGTFTSEDNLYVNGMAIYDFEEVQPCLTINQSNYYFLLNESIFNYNETCVIVDNVSNSFLNFANELIDGDNLSNGSLRGGVCPVIVNNSVNVTVVDLRTQQFFSGICIYNSTGVRVYGTTAVENFENAFVTNGSTVIFENISFPDTAAKVVLENGSYANFSFVSFATATVSGQYYDTQIGSAQRPDLLPIQSASNRNITQHLEVLKTQNNGWAQIIFHYTLPLPNSVIESSLEIFRFHGDFKDNSYWDGDWFDVESYLNTGARTVTSANQTSFSVFAPLGAFSSSTSKGGGSGETPSAPTESAPPPVAPVEDESKSETPALTTQDLDLFIPSNMTLMQGQALLLGYTIKNYASYPYYQAVLTAQVPQGWKSGTRYYDQLRGASTSTGDFEVGAYEKALPGVYQVPVILTAKRTVDDEQIYKVTKILTVTVTPRGNLSRIKVYDYENVIRVPPRSEYDMYFLTKNIGDVNLEHITIDYVANNCTRDFIGDHNLKVNELRNLSYLFLSYKQGYCQYSVRFVEGDTLLEFVPLTVIVSYTVYAEKLGVNIWWVFAIGGAIFGLFLVRFLRKGRE